MDAMSMINRDFMRSELKKGKRIDGRGFDEFRKITVMKNPIGTAEGSAFIALGNTKVLTGVKMTVDRPFSDTPDRGVLITNAELRPAASPTFESGPPRPESIEFSRVVDRGIRESNMIDLKKLCITAGEKVWVVFLDFHVLDYSGNLFDAGNFGAMVALSNTKVPEYEGTESYPIPINALPVSTTFAKIDSSIIADPGLEEETIADARLTIALDGEGNVRAMQKGGKGKFTFDEVMEIIKRATPKNQEIREMLKETSHE